VQITYDVETGGAMEKVELPFIVGVLADLSGQPKEPPKPLKERKVVAIDRDNFDNVLAKAAPRLALRVPDRLTDSGDKIAVELNFKSLEDFEPGRVVEQVEPMRKLLEMRQQLTQLLSKMEGNDKLERLLAQVLSNTEAAKDLSQKMSGDPTAEAGAVPPPE
jgi:type VI secretion system protein ImpB